jgi:hypothetical protein
LLLGFAESRLLLGLSRLLLGLTPSVRLLIQHVTILTGFIFSDGYEDVFFYRACTLKESIEPSNRNLFLPNPELCCLTSLKATLQCGAKGSMSQVARVSLARLHRTAPCILSTEAVCTHSLSNINRETGACGKFAKTKNQSTTPSVVGCVHWKKIGYTITKEKVLDNVYKLEYS